MVASGYRHTDLLIHTSKLEAIVTVTQHIMHDTQQQTIQWDRCPTLIGAHLFNTNFYNPLLHEFIELPQHKEPVAMETIMTNHICKQAVLLLQVHWPAYQTHWPAHLIFTYPLTCALVLPWCHTCHGSSNTPPTAQST